MSQTPLHPLAALPSAKPERKHFRRVAIPAQVYLTIPVPADPSKQDIRDAVHLALTHITDSEDKLPVTSEQPLLTRCDVKVHFAKLPEQTINEEPIWNLRGLTVVDAFTQEPE